MRQILTITIWALGSCAPAIGWAQRVGENVVTEAGDAFGFQVAGQLIGLYNAENARGFNPTTAGNLRIEGLYFDRQGGITDRALDHVTIEVGLTALAADLPAPSGVADHQLKQVGEKPVTSIRAGLDEYVSPVIEVETAYASADQHFTLAAGAGWSWDTTTPTGGHDRYNTLALVPRWRPNDRVSLTAFGSRIWYGPSDTSPTIYTAGSFLPPVLKRGEFNGQRWARGKGTDTNLGVLADIKIADGWLARAGVFYSEWNSTADYAQLFLNTTPNGVADEVIIAFPSRLFRSWSGEARLERLWSSHAVDIRLLGSVRARRSTADNGGSVALDLGPRTILTPVDRDKPAIAFDPLDQDKIRQWTGGIGLQVDWHRHGQLNLGVQKINYTKSFRAAGADERANTSKPWLYNAAIGVQIVPGVIAYAGYARGLEESGTAPSNAVNADDVLPATITTQRDAGVRIDLAKKLKLIAAVFDIRKPYANLDSGDFYRFLGGIRNRGVEVSLTGEPIDGMTLVLGALIQKARLNGDEVDRGLISRRPVGFVPRELQVSVDYQVPALAGVSVDTTLFYYGARPAKADGTLSIPARVVVDIGARYRFDIFGVPAMARVSVPNVFNNYGWAVDSSEGFQYNGRRRWSASLTVDL